ncbi:MAG: hypothetical protein AAB336_12165 [Acidobacteriota bacterium]
MLTIILCITAYCILLDCHETYGQSSDWLNDQYYSPNEINLDVATLPPNYHGNNLREVMKEANRRLTLVRDEFETTAQFKERQTKEKSKNLIGNITYNSNLAIETRKTGFSYDADQQLLKLSLEITYPFSVDSYSLRDFSLFDDFSLKNIPIIQELPIEIEKARKTKPNLSALIIGSIVWKNTDFPQPEEYLNFSFKELWFYDVVTGEVFGKHNILELKKKMFGLKKKLFFVMPKLVQQSNTLITLN